MNNILNPKEFLSAIGGHDIMLLTAYASENTLRDVVFMMNMDQLQWFLRWFLSREGAVVFKESAALQGYRLTWERKRYAATNARIRLIAEIEAHRSDMPPEKAAEAIKTYELLCQALNATADMTHLLAVRNFIAERLEDPAVEWHPA